MRCPGLRPVSVAVPAVVVFSLLTVGLTPFTTPAQAARLPQAPGTVYVAEADANQVVAIPPDGGRPTTVLGDVAHPTALALDDAGDLFVAVAGDGRILKLPADGSAPTAVASGLQDPEGVAVDAAGDIFVANAGANQVLKFPAGGGAPTSLGTRLVEPTGVAVNDIGDVFIADFGADKVYELPAEGGPQHSVGGGLSHPWAVAIKNDRSIAVTDNGHHNHNRVVEIDTGDNDTVNTGLQVSMSKGVYVDDAGDIYVADGRPFVTEKRIGGTELRIRGGLAAPSGVAAITPNFPAGSPPANASIGTAYSFRYQAYDATGAAPVYVRSGGRFPPGLTLNSATGRLSGTPTKRGSFTSAVENTTNHTLTVPATINVSGPGTRFFGLHKQQGDGEMRVLERVHHGAPLRRVGAGLYVPNGLALDAAGDLYIAEDRRVTEVPANGRPPHPVGNHLNAISDVAVDSAGNVYIADTRHRRVVRVPPGGGTQTTIASKLHRPISVAVDRARNVYVLSARGTVVKLPADGGRRTTVARGFVCRLPEGTLSRCPSIAADAKGDVYVADPKHDRVIKIPAKGNRRHTVGTGLSRPSGVAVDAAGNVYIADTRNQRVVKLTAGGHQRVVARNLFGVVDVEAMAQ